MKIGDIVSNIFAKKSQDASPRGLTNPTALSQSTLYAGVEWPQYNPDDLMNRKGFDIYTKMLNDEQIKVVVRFRRNATTSRDWVFEYDDDVDLSDSEKELRIGLFKEIVKKLQGSFKARLDGVMTSLVYGFSITEKVYDTVEYKGKSYIGIKNLRKKPFDSFYFVLDEFGDLVKFYQDLEGNRKTLDINRFIHHVHNFDCDEWYGRSELRECYRAYFTKDMAYRFRNVWLERCAAGFPVFSPKEDSDIVITEGTNEYNNLVNMLTNIKTNTGFLLPKGIDLEIHTFGDTEAYDRAIDDENKAISKALLMPNLIGFSEENKFGSRNLGDTQLEAFLWMLDSEAQELEETLNEQLFKQLGELNFEDSLAPTFRFSPLSDTQIHNIIQTWGELVGKGAVQRTDEDESHVRTLLKFPEKGEVKDEQPAISANKPNGGNDDRPSSVGDDETIIGNEQLTIAYTRAMRRVDVAAIDNSAQTIEFIGLQNLSDTVSEAIASMAEGIKELDLNDPGDANKIKFPKAAMREVKKNIKGTIQAAWKMGKGQGKQEIAKSLKKKQRGLIDDPRLNFARLEDVAAKYFDVESFAVAGTLSEDVVKVFKREILNGIKFSKSHDQIIAAIYEQLASEGLLSEEEAINVLGQAMGVEDPSHRLKTIVRTNTFNAINEARFSFFTDPALGGFVEALEYSAVLDSRTTSICQHLDGKIYPVTAKEWDKYRPPNHFNCRAILIPVTQNDVWEESEAPSIDPQQGFG